MTVEQARAYMGRLLPLLERREILLSRLERLQDRARYVAAPVLDGLPRGSRTSDRTARTAMQITDTENELKALAEKIDKARDEICDAIDLLPAEKRSHARQVDALYCRFVEGLSWRDVCRELYGRRQDYTQREDSFLRQTTRQVKQGLERLGPLLPDELMKFDGRN